MRFSSRAVSRQGSRDPLVRFFGSHAVERSSLRPDGRKGLASNGVGIDASGAGRSCLPSRASGNTTTKGLTGQWADRKVGRPGFIPVALGRCRRRRSKRRRALPWETLTSAVRRSARRPRERLSGGSGAKNVMRCRAEGGTAGSFRAVSARGTSINWRGRTGNTVATPVATPPRRRRV